MPRHLFLIIVAFLCGYLLAKFTGTPPPAPDQLVSGQVAGDQPNGRSSPATRPPRIPARSEAGAGAAESVGGAPAPALGSDIRRQCTVTGIVLSLQDSHLIYCQMAGGNRRSLVVEIRREATDRLARLRPGEIVIATGRVANVNSSTLWLEEGRIETRD